MGSTEIKVAKEEENLLLERREVSFTISHEGGSTPRRFEVREALASMLRQSIEKVLIVSLRTETGKPYTRGVCHVYKGIEAAKRLAPAYIHLRNAAPKKEGEGESASGKA